MAFRIRNEPEKPVRLEGEERATLSPGLVTQLADFSNIESWEVYTGSDHEVVGDLEELLSSATIMTAYDYDGYEIYWEVPVRETDKSFAKKMKVYDKKLKEYTTWKRKNKDKIAEELEARVVREKKAKDKERRRLKKEKAKLDKQLAALEKT